ncbi:MAG: hypothetical protein U9N84_06890 [Actinomycetota bacterium]|nr:hypothetical protein [Actinomycetota bacterium]
MGTPDKREKQRKRLRSVESAAIAGVIYAVLAVAALVILTRFPALTLSNADLTAWFDSIEHQAALILGLNLAAVSAIAFLWFVAVIRRRIGDREDRLFATVFLGSAIAYVAIWLVGAAVLAAPAVAMTISDTGTVNRETATLASGLAAALILVVAPRIQAVFILTTSTVILRTRVLPKWLAYYGYLTALIVFTVPLVSQPTGFGLPAYVLVVSITILVIKPKTQNAGPMS